MSDVEEAWVLSDKNLPESNLHRDIVDLLRLILIAFVTRMRLDALVVANLACRWSKAKPQLGIDPDIALLQPAPPEGSAITSLRTWRPGHVPPRFAIEVVSETNAEKDYAQSPARYARLGTRELVVYDPSLFGPKARGGPHLLQVWRLKEGSDRMQRSYAGKGPVYSEELQAWLVVTAGPRLRVAADAEGRSLWLTEAEEQAALRRQAEQLAAREKQLAAIEDICDLCAIPLDPARRAHLDRLDVAGLEGLRAHLKSTRAWPPAG